MIGQANVSPKLINYYSAKSSQMKLSDTLEYTGDLHQSVTDMDFTDDMLGISEEKRFQNHNRYLRSLREDTLIIIDNFNVTATQDSFLFVVMKYHCRILFTTRSNTENFPVYILVKNR